MILKVKFLSDDLVAGFDRRNEMPNRGLFILVASTIVALPAGGAFAHQSGHENHEPILERPIGDVKNNFWFDYLSDIREADHELKKDLERARDEEDRRDAIEEYRSEIADANKDYRKEMRERGYRVGRVTVGR